MRTKSDTKFPPVRHNQELAHFAFSKGTPAKNQRFKAFIAALKCANLKYTIRPDDASGVDAVTVACSPKQNERLLGLSEILYQDPEIV